MTRSEEFAWAVGNRIRRFREARGWTQEDLALRAGTDRSRICRYENGQFIPNGFYLVRLAEAFDVTADELLGFRPGNIAERLEHLLLLVPDRHRNPLRHLILSYLQSNALGQVEAGAPDRP